MKKEEEEEEKREREREEHIFTCYRYRLFVALPGIPGDVVSIFFNALEFVIL
jgi:hypothetical protein